MADLRGGGAAGDDTATEDPATADEVQHAAGTPARRRARALLEWGAVIVVAVIFAFLVRTFVVQTYFIPSGSMEPTLQVGDRILVIKLAYRFTSPAIGDVVVFRAPPAERSQCDSPAVADLVKRIVAVPGDTISSSGNQILVDGVVLHENWSHVEPLGTPIKRQTIPANHYFMVGDNHPESCDSRIWGTVPRSDIIGKAVLTFWPLSQAGII